MKYKKYILNVLAFKIGNNKILLQYKFNQIDFLKSKISIHTLENPVFIIIIYKEYLKYNFGFSLKIQINYIQKLKKKFFLFYFIFRKYCNLIKYPLS